MNIYCSDCKENQYKNSPSTKRDIHSHVLNKSKHSGSLSNIIKNRDNENKTPFESVKSRLRNINSVGRNSALMELQQTHGNQYVQRMVSGMQSNLKISQFNDVYEQEADKTASTVIGTSDKQPVKSENSISVPNSVHNVLKSTGQSLDSNIRTNMESHLGEDFSKVRVHTDSAASESAREVKAKAYTVGQDIVFGKNHYNPGTKAGDRLIAHELVHTVQQRAGLISMQRAIDDKHDLKSSRFAGDSTLEDCYDDKARLTKGASGESVRKVQQALFDLGYNLGPTNVDSIYGDFTWNAVKQFKSDQILGWEWMGDVGPRTIRRFDEIFSTGPPNIDVIDLTCPLLRGFTSLEDVIQGKKSLSNGSNGNEVSQIQQILINYGYPLPKYGADGKFGDETASGVKKLQSDHQLDQSGSVDQPSLKCIDKLCATKPPEPKDPCPDGRGIKIRYNRNNQFIGESNANGYWSELSRFAPLQQCRPNFFFNVWFYMDATAPCLPNPPAKGPLLVVEMEFISKKGKIFKSINSSDNNPQYVGQGHPLKPSFGTDFNFKIESPEDTAILNVYIMMHDWNSKRKFKTGIYEDNIECVFIPCV